MKDALWFALVLALAAALIYCVATDRDATCPPERPMVVEDGSCVASEFFDTREGK
jgi:hypothetical protein